PRGAFDAVIRADARDGVRHDVAHADFIRPARPAELFPVLPPFVNSPVHPAPSCRLIVAEPGTHLVFGPVNKAAFIGPPPVTPHTPFVKPAAVSIGVVITARTAPVGAVMAVTSAVGVATLMCFPVLLVVVIFSVILRIVPVSHLYLLLCA